MRALHLHNYKMKYLLHIDTATDTGIVAISADGILIASRINAETRNHAGTINNMINAVLDEAKITLQVIDAIVVCAGPGSYTGLRIGLATAKGLCYSLNKPLLLDNRLTLLAYQHYIQGPDIPQTYISLLIAREKEYFISIYDKNFSCTLQPQHIIEKQLKNFIEGENIQIITNASEAVINDLNISYLKINNNININIASWLLYAFEQYNRNNIVNLSTAEPFYLKQVYTHN